jgi:hypothetical protein
MIRELFELINEYPWTSFFVAIFIMEVLDKTLDILIYIIKRRF